MGDPGLRSLHCDSDISPRCVQIGEDRYHLGQSGDPEHLENRRMGGNQDEAALAFLGTLEVTMNMAQGRGIHEGDRGAVDDDGQVSTLRLIQHGQDSLDGVQVQLARHMDATGRLDLVQPACKPPLHAAMVAQHWRSVAANGQVATA